jgi:hypothetical protein
MLGSAGDWGGILVVGSPYLQSLLAMLTLLKVGMRFAKLENNLITAFWLAMFEYELVDETGNPTSEIPIVNINDFTAHKPSNTKYLKYWRRGENKPAP